MMTLPTRTHRCTLLGALLVGLATLASAHTASASATYPAEVQKVLSKRFGKTYCAPQCNFCHLTNAGGPGMLNPFGTNMKDKAGLHGQGDTASLQGVFDDYFMKQPTIDSDNDSTSDLEEIANFSSPSVPPPRDSGAVCPDVTYGCGARVAAAPPPVDRLGLFSAGLAVLGLAALRRRVRRV